MKAGYRVAREAGYRVSEGGVVHAPPPERYELLMRHRAGHNVKAASPSFEALLDLREQLLRLGYALVRLERQTT